LAAFAAATANGLLAMSVLAVALPLLPPKLADPFWLLAFTAAPTGTEILRQRCKTCVRLQCNQRYRMGRCRGLNQRIGTGIVLGLGFLVPEGTRGGGRSVA